jgi:hypothetical protein
MADLRNKRPVYDGPWRNGSLAELSGCRCCVDIAAGQATTVITGKAMLDRRTDLTTLPASLAEARRIDEQTHREIAGNGTKSVHVVVPFGIGPQPPRQSSGDAEKQVDAGRWISW